VNVRNNYQAMTEQRKRALLDVTQLSPGFCCQGILGMFLDRYFVAEVLARKILSFYQDDTGKTHSDKVQLQQLIAAISYFGIAASNIDIRTMFLGGDGRRATKSARQLRNGYVHSLSSADRNEIEDRSKVLIRLLDNFIIASSMRFTMTDD
jgi:hypothetical protein